MARKPGNAKAPLKVEVLTHDEATRKNIPTAEYQSVMQKNEQAPVRVAYERRNRDLDPQLVWRGKDVTCRLSSDQFVLSKWLFRYWLLLAGVCTLPA